MPATTRLSAAAAAPSPTTSLRTSRWRRVGTSRVAPSSSPTFPYRVRSPVAVTSNEPDPDTTFVPAKTSGACAGSLATGCDSPVSAASSIAIWSASVSRPSAGTTSPSRSSTWSPGTNAAAARETSRPSRQTRAVSAARRFSSARARSARVSRTTVTAVTGTSAASTTAAAHVVAQREVGRRGDEEQDRHRVGDDPAEQRREPGSPCLGHHAVRPETLEPLLCFVGREPGCGIGLEGSHRSRSSCPSADSGWFSADDGETGL